MAAKKSGKTVARGARAKSATTPVKARGAVKASAPAAAIAKETLASTEPSLFPIVFVNPDNMYVSPLNPRKEKFDDDLTSLADTIAAEGIMQALPVRETSKGYEIIFGTRRWRATKLAIGDGRLPDGFKIPCRLVHADDARVKRMALIENISRKNLRPLEEAEAFEAAIEDNMTIPEIAKIHGCSDRHVQRRRKLVKLCPEVKKLLKNDQISEQVARAFADGDNKTQRATLELLGAEPPERYDAERIRAHMLAERFPVHLAAFDAAAYSGDYIDDEETGAKYFADDAQAKKLQEQAIQAKVKELRDQHAWVDRLGPGQAPRDYERVAEGDADAGAIVYLDPTGMLATLAPVIRPEIAAKRARERAGRERSERREASRTGTLDGEASADNGPARLLTGFQVTAVKRAKTQALRAGVAADHRIAMAVMICGLLGARNVRLGMLAAPAPQEWHYETPSLEREAQRLILAPLAEALGIKPTDTDAGEGGERLELRASVGDPKESAKLLPALLALGDRKLQAIFALLVSSRIGADGHNGHQPAEDDFEIALARATGAAQRLGDYWRPFIEKDGNAYFQAIPRERLARLAESHALAATGRTKDAKKSALVALLLGAEAGFWTPDKFPECEFVDEKTLRRSLGFGEAPAAESEADEAEHAIEDLAQEEDAASENAKGVTNVTPEPASATDEAAE